MIYLHYFETNSEFSAAYNGEDYLEPWVSLTSENEKVKYNKTEYEKLFSVPLTFEIQSDGIIYWKAGNSASASTIEYSLNNGEWTSITSTTAGTQISVSSGDTIQFRGNNDNYGGEQSYAVNSNTFGGSTCQFKAYGNIMSLIDSTGYTNLTTLSSANTFCHLMSDCTGLTNAGNLILPATALTFCCYVGMFQRCTSLTTAPVLPATTLDGSCYDSMFSNCTSLTTAPELPATTLATYCYYNMFYGCTSLTTAPELPATALTFGCYDCMFSNCTSLTTTPELPATALADYCYSYMFKDCTSLTIAPELPATILAVYCYQEMFRGCTNLVIAPELSGTTLADYCYVRMFSACTSLTTAPTTLPATTLTPYCYSQMFEGCTSLTTAPELPATTLANYCYQSMFRGCSSLNYIKCLATSISATNSHRNWVYGVSSSGTFVKNPSMSSWPTGVSGIPDGWTTQNAS